MNLVFNRFDIKQQFILTLFILVVIVPNTALGQSCASVSFDSLNIKESPFVPVITAHNEQQLDFPIKQWRRLSSDRSYFFEAGVHTLAIQYWPSRELDNKKLHSSSKKRSGLKVYPKQAIQLSLNNNMHYQIKTTKDDKDNLQLAIKSSTVKKCDGKSNKIFARQKRAETITTDQLPTALSYRLSDLMKKISQHHMAIEVELPYNSIPVSLSQLIGTVIDDKYAENGTALKVLSVLPYSLASKLKLLSGDSIIQLGQNKINSGSKSPDQQLSQYFASLYIGEKVQISVRRNETIVKLDGIFKPMVYPAVSYHLPKDNTKQPDQPTLVNYQKLTPILEFELTQLATEIAQYFQQNGHEQSSIIIEGNLIPDNRIGLSGNRVPYKGKEGLSVSYIESDGFAFLLGLKKHDVIIKVNGVALTDENITNVLNKLSLPSEGDDITLTVARGKEVIDLTKSYTPIKPDSFSFKLDLASIAYARNTLDRLEKYNRVKNRKKSSIYKEKNRPQRPFNWL